MEAAHLANHKFHIDKYIDSLTEVKISRQ